MFKLSISLQWQLHHGSFLVKNDYETYLILKFWYVKKTNLILDSMKYGTFPSLFLSSYVFIDN